ncbi:MULTISPECIES: DUF3073 domain-containing protein [Subtercola]|uniref:DUF3073 domain-containing protein n=1 Tax=Subtercola vilae TaxID=2056433 RepID=A0A4T2BRJ1_9MICO|nr:MULTISPECIES: DUF3073 domain-containing protein [Subtercola]MEA9986966.1 DUF3073 domain-containing protein [Subtercola sp. RTI3]TIH32136.1 DUF3073 domain-containing protein [Subtercola vilae]
MGRGRQKAKHTKVARELKYFSPDTNYSALERELGTHAEPDFAALAAKYDTGDSDDELGLSDTLGLDDDEDDDDDLPGVYLPNDEQRRA